MNMCNVCVVIPVYNHEHAIAEVIAELKPFGLACILVNDGSSNECSTVLIKLAEQERHWITLIQRQKNGGKGSAVIDGFSLAFKNGFSHAIQIDADGQHKLADIHRFLKATEEYPERMILGQPSFDQSAPKKRLYGRVLTNVWIWINTLSFAIADGMCGFRCYPLAAVDDLLKSKKLSSGMDFDIEIVVRLYWQGLNVINILTELHYPSDGVSHFNMLQDNLLISRKHAQLFFGMLCRFPKLIVRNIV